MSEHDMKQKGLGCRAALESEEVQVERAQLRALESLRTENQLAIRREKDAMDEERKRMSAGLL